jgi:acetone carboxylase gamma subunit
MKSRDIAHKCDEVSPEEMEPDECWECFRRSNCPDYKGKEVYLRRQQRSMTHNSRVGL